MNETHTSKIREKILEGIKRGEVTMTSRTYFTLRLVGAVAIAIGILLITIFIFNFLYFSIHVSSHDTLLQFGPRGLEFFALLFPWHLLVIDVGLIILLQWLLRQFKSGYRIPVLYLILTLLAAAALFGLLLASTPLNDDLMARTDRLPAPLGSVYRHADDQLPPGSGICRCTILAIEGNVLLVQDLRQASTTLRIVLPDDDDRATTTNLHVGDTVLIAGDEDDGVIRAFGVHTVPHPRETYEFEIEFKDF
jgi:hypothetical protein